MKKLVGTKLGPLKDLSRGTDEQVIRFFAGYYAKRIGSRGQYVKYKFPDKGFGWG